MTKSELIDIIAKNQPILPDQNVEFAVKAILEQMANALRNPHSYIIQKG